MKGLTGVLSVALVLVAIAPAACQGGAMPTTAATINKNPEDWVNKDVTLQGTIMNLQPSLGISQYDLRDGESVIQVRTEAMPTGQELIRPMMITGTVRIDPGTSRPYIWELRRGQEVPTLLYVLIGSGALLIVLAIVLAVMLTRKPAARPEQIEPLGGGHLGDTVEVLGGASGSPLKTSEGPSALAATQQFQASLRVVEGPDAGQGATTITQRVTTIGRSPDKDIQLTDATVSRDHARIVAKDDGGLVLLNESRKGTLVNGRSIDSHTLADGDRVQVGGTVLEARVAGGAGRAAAASATAPTREFTPGMASEGPAQGLGATQEFLGAELEVVGGPNTGQSHMLAKSVTTIGRESDNDWSLRQDETVSRRHCEIRHDKGTFTVVAASDEREGHKKVLVNGEPVVTANIKEGDEIRLGATRITFKKI